MEWVKPRSYNVVDGSCKNGSFKYLGREEQEDLECKVTTPPPLASWANSLSFFDDFDMSMYDCGLDQPKFGGSLQLDGVLLHRVSPLHLNFDLKGVLVKY